MKTRLLRLGLGASLATMLWTSGAALAQTAEKPNNCTSIDAMDCYSDLDCLYAGTFGPNNEQVKVCVATDPYMPGTCEFNCTGSDSLASHETCSQGESCVPVVEGGEGQPGAYWCKPGAFTMDSNLVDMCIAYYLEGRILAAEEEGTCSLGKNLTQMLNQNDDGQFDVLDVDLCVKAFLEPAECDPATKSCPDQHGLYCETDETCGHGLFCNTEANRCERECGAIVDRSGDGQSTLEIPCFGELTWCDDSRGRCVPVPEKSLEKLTCQVDRDCPVGAYCLLGKCAPNCNRSVDCPDANWYCNKLNQCAPVPQTSTEAGGRAFNPTEYAVHLASKSIVLDPVNYDSKIPLVIMDTLTKKQVFDRPEVVLGYRLEVEYLKKLAPDCLKTGTEYSSLPADVRDECELDKDQYFVIPEAPFGTIYGDGTPTIPIRLNEVAANKLSPGRYQATLRIMFNNGSSDSAVITYHKTQLGGNYAGRLKTYFGHAGNPVADAGLSLQIGMDMQRLTRWNDLLEANSLTDTSHDEPVEDITEGYSIVGRINAKGSPMFTKPGARAEKDNFIKVKGIYSRKLGRMRLIGVIDLPATDCVGEGGTCGVAPGALEIRNPFKRKVRRVIEFIGPFDERTRTFRGVYRDKISGLNPAEAGGTITIQGEFVLGQMNDEVAFEQNAWQQPLLPSANAGTTVSFPSREAAIAQLDAQMQADGCDATARAFFHDGTAYGAYVSTIDIGAPEDDQVLPLRVSFRGEVGKALAALNGTTGNSYLSFYDLVRDQLRFCDATSSSNDSCIDKKMLRCGLNLYRKALLSLPEWRESWGLPGGQSGLGSGATHPLFCDETTDGAGQQDCSLVGSPVNADVVTRLAHNRFYKELTQTLGFSAGAAANEASILLYKKAAGLPLSSTPGVILDTAFAFKKHQLRTAFNYYEDARSQVLGPAPAYILYEWPMQHYVGYGQGWIQQMRGLMRNRLDALEEYLDLVRRQQRAESEAFSMFTQHVGQQEFLTQVYLMNLQAQWEGANYMHASATQDSMERVTGLLTKSDITRNPFGLEQNRVYFENTDPMKSNWEFYRDRAQAKHDAAKVAINEALAALRENLQSKQRLEQALKDSRRTNEAIIDNLCGPELVSASGNTAEWEAACSYDDPKRLEEESCFGQDCKAAWNCSDSECEQVFRTFEQGMESLRDGNKACVLNNPAISITFMGSPRSCGRGQVGELLQEQVLLEMQKKQTVAKLATTVAAIQAHLEYVEKVKNVHAWEVVTGLVEKAAVAVAAAATATGSAQAAELRGYSLTCIKGPGGTDCDTKFGALQGAASAVEGLSQVAGQSQALLEGARLGIQLEINRLQNEKEVAREMLTVENLLGDAELTVHTVAILTQQAYNLDLRIADLVKQAKAASFRHQEDVQDVIAAVSGENVGQSVTMNAKLAQSNRLMREALVEAYKMTVAYLHRSNSRTKWEGMVNKVYTAVTLGDLQERVDEVSLAASTCTESDCDGPRNSELRWFSMRNNLFPTLSDIVAADTGAVLTKGEQFHNILSSSAYRRRRMVGGNMLDVVEIPFATRALAGVGDAGFTVNSCNDVIVPFKLGQVDAGTLVVNFLLNRPPSNGDAPEYVLVRGSTDQMLGCRKTEPLGGGAAYFPISSFLVGPPGGYADPMAGGTGTSEPFFTQSGSWKACVNAPRSESALFDRGCFKTFARERSFASQEWVMVIPLVPGTATAPGKNTWLLDGNTTLNDIEIGLRVSSATRANN